MPGITFQTKQTQCKPLIATFTEQSFNYWGGGGDTAVALECCEFSFLIQQQ